MKVLTLIVCLALTGCSGGRAVKVDCDGPFTLINAPVTADGAKAAPKAAPRPAEVRKP